MSSSSSLLLSTFMSKLRMNVGSSVVPGDRIGNVRHITSGSGTYVESGNVFASLVGTLKVSEEGQASVEQTDIPPSIFNLQIGQVVYGKIIRLTHLNAVLDIVAVVPTSTDGNVVVVMKNHDRDGSGMIRKEDIINQGTQTPQIYDSFRPGDVVLCKLISFGDDKRYLFTTAEPELGVVYAACRQSGESMIPISHNEMQCPITKIKESRKCAKPTSVKKV